MSILIGGLLVALLVVGVVGATNALAQSSPATPLHGRGPGGGRGLGQAELEAAAKVLDMTANELSAALQAGKTLQDVADEAGVAIEDIQAAIQAAHAVAMRSRIATAEEDGTLTQENADWLLEGLDKGFIGVPGAFSLGGPHGDHGLGNGSLAQPTQSSGQ